LPLEELRPFLLEAPPANADPIVDWSQVFANPSPVEIEVGFGKGGWLIDAAIRHPNVNFLGIEVVRALQLYCATRAAKRNLANARVACTDARHFLAHRVAPQSVAAIHVYFPDPWWKKRHKKRRVFTPEFAEAGEKALVMGGILQIGTDVEEYFEVMTEIIASRPGFREIQRLTQAGPAAPADLMTNFERKARQAGGSVWRATYVRVETAEGKLG
jgi:tRNA (guanine-N7-)-methyltransferase